MKRTVMKSQDSHFDNIVVNRMLATFLLMFVVIGIMYFSYIPNPGMILLTVLAMVTSVFGTESGIVGIAMFLLYVMYFYSADQSLLRYNSDADMGKVIVSFLCSLICVLFLGQRQSKR